MSVEVFAGDRATHYDNFVETWIPCYHKFVGLLPNLLLNGHFDSNAHGKKVLIAGCGTGNEIDVLAKASSDWQLTGIDPSPEMIAQAKLKLTRYANFNLIEGVVADLPVHQSNQYDAATLLLVLHFLEDNGDKLALLKDMSARLKPQAPLITFDITGSRQHIQHNLPLLASLLPNDIDQEVVACRLDRMQNKLYHVTEQRFIELCLEAGFETPIRFFQSTIYMCWVIYKEL